MPPCDDYNRPSRRAPAAEHDPEDCSGLEAQYPLRGHWFPATRGLTGLIGLALLLQAGAREIGADTATPVARWLFDEGSGPIAGDGGDGAANGKIFGAAWSPGVSGKALAFEDYSAIDYLKPDVSKATRVVVPHLERLNPGGAFTLRAMIQPARDPLFYGGIIEKGRGYGASYRLMVLRGLRVRVTLGSAQSAVTSAEPLSVGRWHELEAAYDGASLVLRIDGKEAGRVGGVKAPMASKADLVIGERFSGKIDRAEITAP